MENNTLMRSHPCPQCGAAMLWTQNAWKTGDIGAAAYRCAAGHAIDPAQTRQCPSCGVHDTSLLGVVDGRQQFKCDRCAHAFTFPH